MNEEHKRRSASEYIAHLRKEFDIPEPDKMSKEELEQERREKEARHKRLLAAGTEEGYVKMFNRDPWTDEWLGPGPEPPMPFLEDSLSEKKQASVIDKRKKKEHDEWAKRIMPTVPNVKMPEIKETKAIRKARAKRDKETNKAERQVMYDVAYWLLNDFLDQKSAMEIYTQFADDFEGMVDYCYEFATEWAQYMTYEPEDKDLSIREFQERLAGRQQDREEVVENIGGMKFKRREVADRHKRWYEVDLTTDPFPDIPDEYWDEFCKWSKDHPIDEFRKKAKKMGWGVSPAGLRRAKFLKHINKRNKGFRKNLMLHDPITGASFVSEKKMKEHFERQMKNFEKQRHEFAKMIDGMVERGELSKDAALNMIGSTEEAKDRITKRYREITKRARNNEKEIKKRLDHDKQVKKARAEWFKKFGYSIDDAQKPFTIEAAGEKLTVEVIQPKRPGGKKLYKVDRPGRGTDIAEDVESFMQ